MLAAISALLSAPPPSLSLSPGDFLKNLPPEDKRNLLQVGVREDRIRPEVRNLPRARMDLNFSIMLMRSSYAVADELDFMPMNDFQRNLFVFRQNEWEQYKDKLPVRQGDLSDPNYFDFMSLCQYATIASGMRNGRELFEELVDANGTTVVVNRAVADPPSPMSNRELPGVHAERVGRRILKWIDENSPGFSPRVPLQGRPETAMDLADGINNISTAFELSGYMLTAAVEPLTDNGRQVGISWTLVAPATLWSAQVLAQRGDTPVNDFAAKAALAYLQRCGVPAKCTTRFEKGTKLVHEIRWLPGFM